MVLQKLNTHQSTEDLLAQRDNLLDLLPDDMEEVTIEDAEYHANAKEKWLESNQILSEHNLYFHQQIMDEVAKATDKDSVILELGGGVGFDAGLFLRKDYPFKCYILSEISPSMMEFARKSTLKDIDKPVVFSCIDANNIMIADNQVDVAFIISALHHVPDTERTIAELDRITTENSRIIVGFEPNLRWMTLLTKSRPIHRRFFDKTEHSAADEVAEGFNLEYYHEVAEKTGWTVERVVPVWFFCGFLHYGLDAIYRLFRQKKHMRLPKFLTRILLGLDKLFFLLPFTKNIAFHYTVIYKKGK